jgi:oligopeptide/dipeptide ABC transporter ATP-binding protein
MLLEVKNLSVQFGSGPHAARAVNDVSISIDKGETVGLVGESGCGKSVTALSILRLLDSPGRIAGGEILLNGENLLSLSERRMRHVRGKKISMVFQEPMTSFNPVFTIGDQLIEAIRVHQPVPLTDAWSRSVELLDEVGIPSPEERMLQYPHELSGGMKQRAMIAMALLGDPQLLIADEPTTALDVTVQAQILDLAKILVEKRGMAMLLITHDLSVVAEVCDRVYVMYASRIAEAAPVRKIFENPLHPYTRALFRCLPRIDKEEQSLDVIPGNVPDPSRFPPGCRFHPRCPISVDICKHTDPPLELKRNRHFCACHRVEKDPDGEAANE